MMKTGLMMLALGGGLAGATGAAPAAAAPKTARCVVETRQTIPYDGPCVFAAERGGTFAVSRRDGRNIVGDVSSITVAVVGGGKADVRGLVGGINSRWGSATRSRRDRACWIGEDFRVCAY